MTPHTPVSSARVAQLLPLQVACIVASYAPRFEECLCCRNKDKMMDDDCEAIATLAEWAISRCSGMMLRNMRGAIVRSFFERGVSIAEAAKELDVAKATAYDQRARTQKTLKEVEEGAQRDAADLLASII